MPYNTFKYNWNWQLKSSPEDIWKLAADTNRFNMDTGLPDLVKLKPTDILDNSRRRLKFHRLGVPVQWIEEPFEWVFPNRFGVVRRYESGPVKEMRVRVELIQTQSGGTHLKYNVEVDPANALGLLAIPLQVGLLSRRSFDKAFKLYDYSTSQNIPIYEIAGTTEISSSGSELLHSLCAELEAQRGNADIVGKIRHTVETADTLTLAKMRPFTFADSWKTGRKRTLEMFLYATRLGILGLKWDILCPMCRGSSDSHSSLIDIDSPVHCDNCNIDYNVNFDKLVEIAFSPNPLIRKIDVSTFCIGGPQVTPHIVVQQLVEHGETVAAVPQLEPGKYRMRSPKISGGMLLSACDSGTNLFAYTIDKSGWGETEYEISTNPEIRITNNTGAEILLIFERMAWIDDAVTAAEVTALQTFRDLFTNEALRPGQQISVGSVALLFTDLKNSTTLYRQIGDATAFGYVMRHFDILKSAIDANNGALVKTIGDATMAVFTDPLCAIKAIVQAQMEIIKSEPGINEMRLKSGIHYGHCIAVNLNSIFDYFGSTVNIAARLEGLSSGNDIIISDFVYKLPQVRKWLDEMKNELSVEMFATKLKGFEEEQFGLWKLRVLEHNNG